MPINGSAGKGLFFLGKNSTYMWLTHSWLIYKFMQPIIYGLHDVAANLCVLLVIDLVISYFFKKMELGIGKSWKTIGYRLQAVSNMH